MNPKRFSTALWLNEAEAGLRAYETGVLEGLSGGARKRGLA
jgi:hypothetical protein